VYFIRDQSTQNRAVFGYLLSKTRGIISTLFNQQSAASLAQRTYQIKAVRKEKTREDHCSMQV
jgi:hypothetical protein